MKRYIPIKRLLDLFHKISKEGPVVKESCTLCGKKEGDLYLLKKDKYLFYLFKVRVRKHRMFGCYKYISVCDGCHLRYHLNPKPPQT